MDKIAVVIPLFNASEYIGACLASLQKQSHSAFRAIICDNGSSDGSLAIAREAVTGDDRFVFVEEAQRGIDKALNRALGQVRSEWVAFLDNDDIYHPEKLAKSLAVGEARQAVMVACFARKIDNLGRPLLMDSGVVATTQKFDFDAELLPQMLCQGNIFSTLSNMVVRRDVLDNWLPFPTRCNLALDYYLALGVVGDGLPVALINEPLVDRRFHQQNVSRNYADTQIQVMPMIAEFDRRRPVLDAEIRRRIRSVIYARAVQILRRTGKLSSIPGYLHEYVDTYIESNLYQYYQAAARLAAGEKDAVERFADERHPLAAFIGGFLTDDHVKAADRFAEAWASSGNGFPEALNNQAVRLARLDPARSIDLLHRALRGKPNYLDALGNLQILLSGANKPLRQTLWLMDPTIEHFIFRWQA